MIRVNLVAKIFEQIDCLMCRVKYVSFTFITEQFRTCFDQLCQVLGHAWKGRPALAASSCNQAARNEVLKLGIATIVFHVLGHRFFDGLL